MKETVREEVFKRLDALAEKLGVAAGHLWEVLLRQADVTVYRHVAWGLFALVVLCAGILVCRWAWRREANIRASWNELSDRARQDKWGNRPDNLFPIFLTLPAVVLPLVSFLAIVTSCMTPLFNPEYWALQRVILLLGGR